VNLPPMNALLFVVELRHARGAPSCVRYRARPACSYSELLLLAAVGLAVERESV